VTRRARRRSSVALKAFFRLSTRWNLGEKDRASLLAANVSDMERWKQEPTKVDLTDEQLLRLSYVFGIFHGLHAVFGDAHAADEWLRRPNSDFENRAPLEQLLAGGLNELAAMCDYVDAWRF
jgi:uncharacterized protein (DUF2384 family)